MKYILPLLLCIITGFLMGLFIYGGYNKEVVIPTIMETKNIYLVKYGTFDSKTQMEKSLINFSNYIFTENNIYTVYLTLTTNEQNIKKIEGFYKDMGYIVSIEEKETNLDTYNKLADYDTLLLDTNDKIVIQNILYAIVDKYKELYS